MGLHTHFLFLLAVASGLALAQEASPQCYELEPGEIGFPEDEANAIIDEFCLNFPAQRAQLTESTSADEIAANIWLGVRYIDGSCEIPDETECKESFRAILNDCGGAGGSLLDECREWYLDSVED